MDDTAPTTINRQLSDVDRLQLHNLLLQQQTLRAQLNLLTVQFLQTPEPRALNDRINELTTRINATTEQVFAAHQIDPKMHSLDVERGVFVPRRD